MASPYFWTIERMKALDGLILSRSVHKPDLPSHAMCTGAGPRRPFTSIILKPDPSFRCPRGS